jgi:hypothetical protein
LCFFFKFSGINFTKKIRKAKKMESITQHNRTRQEIRCSVVGTNVGNKHEKIKQKKTVNSISFNSIVLFDTKIRGEWRKDAVYRSHATSKMLPCVIWNGSRWEIQRYSWERVSSSVTKWSLQLDYCRVTVDTNTLTYTIYIRVEWFEKKVRISTWSGS